MPVEHRDARTTCFLGRPVCGAVLLTIAAVFFLCRFVHLAADYPRWVRWDDGVLTDEGWYASAAINLHAWGRPLLSGDMNTAVLMPVWPLLAHLAFQLFGFHVEVLRGLAVVTTLLAAGMLVAVLRRYGAGRFVPLFLLLLAVNPWAFVLSRAAFLESPMLVFFFAALLLLTASRPRSVAAGILFSVAVLTKISALSLMPVLLFAVAQAHGFRWRVAVRDGVLLFGTAVVVAASFYATVIRRFATDALYYLSAIPSHTTSGVHALLAQATRPLRYGLGADHLLFTLGVVLLPVSAVVPQLRRFWRDPLFALAGVWLVSVLLALVLLNNVMVHYLALAIPALLLLAIAVLRATWIPVRWQTVFALLLCSDAAGNAVQTASFILQPRYSLRDASQQIDSIVHAEAGVNNVVLGDNAPEVALQSRTRPVNLFAHAAFLSRQVDRFQPDWWLQYTPEDDGRCFRVLLQQAYTANLRGNWTVPDGRRLLLYRLQKIPGTTLPRGLSEAERAACRSPYVTSVRESPDVPVDSRWSW